MRTAFINTLTELAKNNENLWLLTGDLGFSVVENFEAILPNQYLNAGVSEQNMIGMAAGLAMCGKTVFTYSIVPFITMRCFEQVRNDLCMQNVNVKIVGVGAGFSNNQMGPTHHSIEDIAVMRALPNMIVVCPGDPWEVEEATKAIAKINTPAYLRIGKKGEPTINSEKGAFVIGKGILLNEGGDLTLVSTGNMLETASLVCEKLAKINIRVRLISMHTVKPLDEKLIIESAEKTGAIFTIEEHSIIGGLGSAVAQVLMENGKVIKFHSFGVKDKFTKIAGDQDYLRKINGLDPSGIAKNILKIIQAKG